MKKELKTLLLFIGLFILFYFLPTESIIFKNGVYSSLELTKWYAREHIIFCLIPAFFIAGVISVFISQAAVLKYFGSEAKKWVAYSIASVSGAILAVCSCTILPLFTGIYKRGAGLGPAVAFLYAGPGINILSIILTARILGFQLGVARVVGAVFFSVVIGLIMQFIFKKEQTSTAKMYIGDEDTKPLWQTTFHFATLVGILVFANWGAPQESAGLWFTIWKSKWIITGLFGLLFTGSLLFIIKTNKIFTIISAFVVAVLGLIFKGNPLIPFVVAVALTSILLNQQKGEAKEWLDATWDFSKQILPLLVMGVLIAGFLLGTPTGGTGIIPNQWIAGLVGGNSIFANFFASFVGAFMYFATLTEVPILQGLIANGMGKGPALALLLAGPALSLPNMLVIRGVLGTKKTVVFVSLVVVMATMSGFIFGLI